MTILCTHGTLHEECPHCSLDIMPVDDEKDELMEATRKPILTRERLEQLMSKSRPPVYMHPHPDFVVKVPSVLPHTSIRVRFFMNQPFRGSGLCALNSSGDDWSVSSIIIGMQEQFAVPGRLKLSLLRQGIMLMTANMGVELIVQIMNDTDREQPLELMLCGLYASSV